MSDFQFNKSVVFCILLIVSSSLSYTQDLTKQCLQMRDAVFVYGGGDEEIKMHFMGSKHVEMHKGGRYFIKSDIEWVSACEYNLRLEEITLPDFPFSTGDVMNVKIFEFDGPKVSYLSTVNGRSWEGTLLRVDK